MPNHSALHEDKFTWSFLSCNFFQCWIHYKPILFKAFKKAVSWGHRSHVILLGPRSEANGERHLHISRKIYKGDFEVQHVLQPH